MSDIHFQGFWRMDWGLGNPNKTAALIAMLMIAVWGIGYVRRWGFWIALAPFIALGICLIHTYSRGGLISAFAGWGVLLLWAPRPWPITRVAAMGIAIVTMIMAAIYLQADDRYSQGISAEDRSITNRLDLWQYAPAMMASAPGGWGLGKSGEAFMQWYQPTDRSEVYRTMVNSHLTWLVEFGWIGRFFYMLGWLAAFLLCWPIRGVRWMAVPLGIWTCFAISSLFSSIAESPWLWILPGSALVVCVVFRLIRKTVPSSRSWGACAGAAAAICALFWIAGYHRSLVHQYSDFVSIGSGVPEIWILTDQQVVGKIYGKTLRKFLQDQTAGKTIGITSNAAAISHIENGLLIITGKRTPEELRHLAELAHDARRIILLSPRFYPQEYAIDAAKLETAFGEFSQSSYASAWEQTGTSKRVSGAADFFPSWPAIVLSTP